jgi:flagellin-specific chaperone FliS
LYVFFQAQLSEANAQMDANLIDPVITMMTDLRSAWSTAVAEVEGAAA